MELDWIGRAVSIVCDDNLGIFQGMIKDINASEITIVRAFRNGVPLRKQNAEVVLKSSDIVKIDLIPEVNGESCTVTPVVINKPTPVKLPNFSNILGAKQQQERLQQQERAQLQQEWQQQQQQQQQHRTPASMQFFGEQQKPRQQQQQRFGTPRGSSNGGGGGGGYMGVGGNNNGGESANSKSTLSAKMQNMTVNSNGLRTTPNNSRASSAQQQPIASGSKISPPERSRSTTNSGNTNSVAMFFGGMIPPKVEVKMGAVFSNCVANSASSSAADAAEMNGYHYNNGLNNMNGNGSGNYERSNGSRPIDIISNNDDSFNQYQQHQGSFTNANGGGGGGNGGGGRRNGNGSNNGYGNGSSNHNNSSGIINNGNGNSNKKQAMQQQQQRNKVRRENSIKHQQTFGTSVDDPQIHEDFDFEGNLALFDKRAIWNDIESTGPHPDVARHNVRAQQQKQQKYRHDENVLESAPLQLRQIQTKFDGAVDYVTDEGLIIPTIPQFVRAKIEETAKEAGLSLQRQVDILARGTCDLAISLLGGARRLTPNNSHQWPKIVIICDGQETMGIRSINIGAATGRQLASHGLTVLLYMEKPLDAEQSIEISLFKATDNTIVHSIDALPNSDLVILSTDTAILSKHVKKWLDEKNRAPILAIDPPPSGIRDVAVKYSILPILPLNGISLNIGKLYLCNLGIPDKFFRDCGIKYKSPYGHKYVIPIHSKD